MSLEDSLSFAPLKTRKERSFSPTNTIIRPVGDCLSKKTFEKTPLFFRSLAYSSPKKSCPAFPTKAAVPPIADKPAATFPEPPKTGLIRSQ